MKQLVIKYIGAQETTKRILPTHESVTPDVNGLEKLIVNKHFDLNLI